MTTDVRGGPTRAGGILPAPGAFTVAGVVAAIDARYPTEWAESWDRVGLVVGDPSAPVRRVLLAVDCVPETVDEAVALGAQLMVVHHPLLLRGVHSVATTSYKGAVVHRLIRAGIALYVAHTNADVASPGVSDALAARLELHAVRPLVPQERHPGRVGAYLTADLRHHPSSEHVAGGGPALLDAPHRATERPWLDMLAAQLRGDLAVDVVVSDLVTDVWTVHAPAETTPSLKEPRL